MILGWPWKAGRDRPNILNGSVYVCSYSWPTAITFCLLINPYGGEVCFSGQPCPILRWLGPKFPRLVVLHSNAHTVWPIDLIQHSNLCEGGVWPATLHNSRGAATELPNFFGIHYLSPSSNLPKGDPRDGGRVSRGPKATLPNLRGRGTCIPKVFEAQRYVHMVYGMGIVQLVFCKVTKLGER